MSGDGPADPNPPDEFGQVQSQNGLGTGDGGRGIQPSHIREALRRLSVPSGPLLPLAVSANYGSTQCKSHKCMHSLCVPSSYTLHGGGVDRTGRIKPRKV